MNGVPNDDQQRLVRLAHTSSGMRHIVMPGARIAMIVTRKLSAVMIDEAPDQLDADSYELTDAARAAVASSDSGA